ncbi:hypothetical protein GCM10027168_34870 [Streptomyces capparidis]
MSETSEQTSPRRAARTPRRSPPPDERRLDAQRSREKLLEAAKDEFAAKGYAGARVQDIADRAGLNKQLIAYYFGGKEGLYRELARQWQRQEETFNDPSVPLDELLSRYAEAALADPRGARLAMWQALAGDAGDAGDDWDDDGTDLADMRRRQARGELAPDLDPAAVLLLMMAAVTAPVALPGAAQRLFGAAPGTPEFRERWIRELRRIARHLA